MSGPCWRSRFAAEVFRNSPVLFEEILPSVSCTYCQMREFMFSPAPAQHRGECGCVDIFQDKYSPFFWGVGSLIALTTKFSLSDRHDMKTVVFVVSCYSAANIFWQKVKKKTVWNESEQRFEMLKFSTCLKHHPNNVKIGLCPQRFAVQIRCNLIDYRDLLNSSSA